MPIDITAAGTTGTHTLTKTNLNLEDDYLYINKTASEATPTGFVDGAPFIYRTQAGSVTGLTSGNLVYIKTSDTTKIQFSSTLGGTALDLTAYTAGTYTFNYPNVYSNKFNTATTFASQQAVKYYTAGTPITGLVSGNTWIFQSTLGQTNDDNLFIATTTKTLSSVLDRVRITTTGGTDTFDAGSINITYEG